MWTDFELNTVTDMNGTASLPIIFGIRAKRIKKGSYGISGTVTVTDTFEGYDVGFFIFIFYSKTLAFPKGRSENSPQHKWWQRLESGTH